MKPHEEARRKIVAEWMRKGDEDMSLAEHLLNEGAVFPNAIMFNCQQAVEKYLKAILVEKEIEFPKTHELGSLLRLIATVDAALKEDLQDVIMLTPYGVELRYPGDRPDASAAEAREAVELARKTRKAVMERLTGR